MYVIICELIPDTQEGEHSKIATFGVILRLFNNDDFRCITFINFLEKNVENLLKKNCINDILKL